MNEYTVHHLLGTEKKKLLLVFYSPRHCYQFRVVTTTGEVMVEQKIYYTADEAALREGREF